MSSSDASTARLETIVELESARATQTAALVADLERQQDQLGKVAGDDARRYRQTVWFELVKARAEHAYLTAHLESLHQVLEGGAR